MLKRWVTNFTLKIWQQNIRNHNHKYWWLTLLYALFYVKPQFVLSRCTSPGYGNAGPAICTGGTV